MRDQFQSTQSHYRVRERPVGRIRTKAASLGNADGPAAPDGKLLFV